MLIVGVMETINLAHGSLFALGMYVALVHRSRRSSAGSRSCRRRTCALPLGTRYAIALLLAPVLVGVFGMLLELVHAPHLRQAIRSTACCSPSARRW